MKLYSELAQWWSLLSPPQDYQEEAAFFERLLVGERADMRTLLELGSGGGNNACFLKRRFECTLVDIAPGMLEVSRRLNPECRHLEGDMRTVRLGEQFDAVFVHDALAYVTSVEELRATVATAGAHCRPGGVTLLCPDFVRENFRETTDCGGSDASDGRGLRYLEWVWDPDPNDDTYYVDFTYMLRDPDGTVNTEHERHIEGVFPRQLWLDTLKEAGFVPEVVPFEHSELEPGTHEVFLARKL